MTFALDTTDPAILAAETLGLDLLGALLDELKVAPECWAKMSQLQQDQTIDRLRARTQALVAQALNLLFSGNYPACMAELATLAVKGDGIKGSLIFSKTEHNLHELADAVGRQVVLVIATHEDYTARMAELRAKDKQGDLFGRVDYPAPPERTLEVLVDAATGEILDPTTASCSPPPPPPSPDSSPAIGLP